MPGTGNWLRARLESVSHGLRFAGELCRAHLAPQGVAFVSYVTYPGAYPGQMAREMMRFHMQHFEGTQHKIRQARAMLKLLVEAQTEDTPYRMLLEHARERISTYPDEYLYHDDLSDVWDPCYFHEFAEHAQQHQLKYMTEAAYFENFRHDHGQTPNALNRPRGAMPNPNPKEARKAAQTKRLKRLRKAGEIEAARLTLWRAIKGVEAVLFDNDENDEMILKCTYALAQAIPAYMRVTEATELENRLAELEKQAQHNRSNQGLRKVS